MLFRTKQQLDCLPCHKALLLQCRYSRTAITVVLGRGLKAVECAERAIDEGNGRRRRICEEHIVVAAYMAVPGG